MFQLINPLAVAVVTLIYALSSSCAPFLSLDSRARFLAARSALVLIELLNLFKAPPPPPTTTTTATTTVCRNLPSRLIAVTAAQIEGRSNKLRTVFFFLFFTVRYVRSRLILFNSHYRPRDFE